MKTVSVHCHASESRNTVTIVEVAAGSIPNAVAIPVGQLPSRSGELDPAKPTVVYCAGGYRSSVAASLLRQRGFGDVSDIVGGFNAWEAAQQNA